MLVYEIQGMRFFAEPEEEVKRKMIGRFPPDAEVLVWDGDKIIDKMRLNELWNDV